MSEDNIEALLYVLENTPFFLDDEKQKSFYQSLFFDGVNKKSKDFVFDNDYNPDDNKTKIQDGTKEARDLALKASCVDNQYFQNLCKIIDTENIALKAGAQKFSQGRLPGILIAGASVHKPEIFNKTSTEIYAQALLRGIWEDYTKYAEDIPDMLDIFKKELEDLGFSYGDERAGFSHTLVKDDLRISYFMERFEISYKKNNSQIINMLAEADRKLEFMEGKNLFILVKNICRSIENPINYFNEIRNTWRASKVNFDQHYQKNCAFFLTDDACDDFLLNKNDWNQENHYKRLKRNSLLIVPIDSNTSQVTIRTYKNREDAINIIKLATKEYNTSHKWI